MWAISLALLLALGAISTAEEGASTTATTYIITTYRPKPPLFDKENLILSETAAVHPFARGQSSSPKHERLRTEEKHSSVENVVVHRARKVPEEPKEKSGKDNPRVSESALSHAILKRPQTSFLPTPLPPVREALKSSETFKSTEDAKGSIEGEYPRESESVLSPAVARRQDLPFRPTPLAPVREALRASESSSRHAFARRHNNVQTSSSKPDEDGVEGSESSRHAISRRQDASGRRRPGASGGPPGSGGQGKEEEPDYDDPNADRSYNFRFDSPSYSRREQADPKGEVTGRYTYVDDAGVRRVVDYLAGGRTGFYVRGSYPDPEIPGLSLFQPSYGPGGRGPARARTSVHRGVDGSYRFDYGGPEHRRRESADANGNVRGAYTYLDSQGRTRTVQYIAGPGIGFRVTQNTLGPPGPFVYPFPRPTIVPQAPTTRPRPGVGPATLRPSASTFPANPQAVPRPPQETDFKDETLDNIPDLSSSGGGNFPQGASSQGNPLEGSPFPTEDELPSPPIRGDGGPPVSESGPGKYPSKEFDDEGPGDQSLPPPQPPTRGDDRPFRRGEEVPEENSFEVEDFDKATPNDQEASGQRGGDFPGRDFENEGNGERGGGARPGPFRSRIVGGRSVGEGPYGRKRLRVKGRRANRPIRKDGPPRDYRREENSIVEGPSHGEGGAVPGIALVQSIDLGPAGSGAPPPAAALEAGATYASRRSTPPLRVPAARRWPPSVRDTPT